MFLHKAQSVQVHDLLRLNPELLLDDVTFDRNGMPSWAEEHVRSVPYVVVRRGMITEPLLPIGIRGLHRNERWAVSCSSHAICEVIKPCELLNRASDPSRRRDIPALQSLELVRERWKGLDDAWGPGGSVGFELATGKKVVNFESDLDIVIRPSEPIEREKAKYLCSQLADLPAMIDVRVETSAGGFSLKEYARDDYAKILVRTAEGTVLRNDPWRNDQAA